ncbi:MAG: adenylate/guanylate cyclase domain-containing protein [Pedosphaera sp.]|nr:adenylate/guanylate cyclase domain-containing protein [Pedosphaera sp.]
MDAQIALKHRAHVEEFRRRHRTGLVTLVFSDLVGSTRLKQTLGDREGVAVIQHHHALLREILGHFTEAQEINTAGDSFFIVFVKPSDTARFALQLQARLRALPQTAAAAIQDRIGIHIGEVVIEEREGAPKPRDLYGARDVARGRRSNSADARGVRQCAAGA